MKKNTALRMSGFIGTAGLTVALVGAGVAGTGAYFTDAHAGHVNATIGTILVAPSTDAIEFDSLLPGAWQTEKVDFQNTGDSTQDVWIVFKADDLKGLNTLGRWGGISIKGSGVDRFFSDNLGYPALGTQYLLAEDLKPLAWGSLELGGLLGAKATDQAEVAGWAAAAKTIGGLPYSIVATQPNISPDDPQNLPTKP